MSSHLPLDYGEDRLMSIQFRPARIRMVWGGVRAYCCCWVAHTRCNGCSVLLQGGSQGSFGTSHLPLGQDTGRLGFFQVWDESIGLVQVCVDIYFVVGVLSFRELTLGCNM